MLKIGKTMQVSMVSKYGDKGGKTVRVDIVCDTKLIDRIINNILLVLRLIL